MTKFRESDLTSYLLDVISELQGTSPVAPVRLWDTNIRASVDPTADSRGREAPGHMYAYPKDTRPAGAQDGPRRSPVTQEPSHPDTSAPYAAVPEHDSSVVTHDGDDSRISIADVLNDSGDSAKRPWEGAAPEVTAPDSPLKRQRTT